MQQFWIYQAKSAYYRTRNSGENLHSSKAKATPGNLSRFPVYSEWQKHLQAALGILYHLM